MKGRLKGREDVDYVLGAEARQRMIVTLYTDHPPLHFNVLPTGSDEALFTGSTSGNRFEGSLPMRGDYRIRIDLMRAAARRDEQAHYSLRVHISAVQPTEAPSYPPDFADGLAGGPDLWEVHGVPLGDTLNLRAGPSPDDRVVGEIRNGTVLRNLRLQAAGGSALVSGGGAGDPAAEGWVAGRYLRESSCQP